MTASKATNQLSGDRTPAFVDRETGAAELSISTDTWDRWVAAGRLPRAEPGFPESTPRWAWSKVEKKLCGDIATGREAEIIEAARYLRHGSKASGGRNAA
jgi:hypothetical protein